MGVTMSTSIFCGDSRGDSEIIFSIRKTTSSSVGVLIGKVVGKGLCLGSLLGLTSFDSSAFVDEPYEINHMIHYFYSQNSIIINL